MMKKITFRPTKVTKADFNEHIDATEQARLTLMILNMAFMTNK